MVHYKLFYFNGRGTGEIVRQVFVLSGQKFEDIRYTIDDWPKHKAEMPFGQMPVLEEDGKLLPHMESVSGLSGKNDWEEANVDALIDQWKDFTEIEIYIETALGVLPGDLKALEKDIFAPTVKKHFPLFVAALEKSSSGFLVGNSVTYVDLPVAEFVANVEKETPHLLKDYPELLIHKKKVHDIPEIKKWRETRPKSSF